MNRTVKEMQLKTQRYFKLYAHPDWSMQDYRPDFLYLHIQFDDVKFYVEFDTFFFPTNWCKIYISDISHAHYINAEKLVSKMLKTKMHNKLTFTFW